MTHKIGTDARQRTDALLDRCPSWVAVAVLAGLLIISPLLILVFLVGGLCGIDWLRINEEINNDA